MKLFRRFDLLSISVYLYLIISFFLFCYTLYRAEFIHNGNQFSYYYKYYLIFIIGIFFWFIVLFLKEEKKLQIVIQVTILIFLVYCYETVRFFEPTILKSIPIKSQLDEKTKLEVIQELRINKGVDVVPSVFPKAFFNKKG